MKNRILILLILLIVIGCASTKIDEKKVSIITSPAPPTASPQAIKEKLEELMVSPIEEEIKTPEKLYSLSFRKADIHEILTVLARENKLNMVVDSDVTGRVTVDLKEVTLTRALDCLLTPLGLQYKRDANVIRVSPVRMQTRMFTLNYLTTKRVGSGATSGTTGGRAGEEDQVLNTGSFIKVETSDTADFWKEIEEGLKSISSQEGRLVINKISGSVLATDFPQNLAMIAEFLETIEGTAQKQVMIEARIIEVTLSDEYQMGIDWSSIAHIGSARGTFTQVLSPANEIFRIGVSDSDPTDFSLLLDAMSKQGKIDILSSPKISTLNNQPAIIKVATEDVYWESETTYDSAGVARISSKPRWITIGILLGVTPQISSNGLIIMDIHPSVTEKLGESVSAEGDIAPIMAVRETNTVVKVRDGNTIIIAGLLQEREWREVTGVPFLEDIPFLGYLFKNTAEKKEKTELIITLTPRIVVGNEIENRFIRELSSEWEEVR